MAKQKDYRGMLQNQDLSRFQVRGRSRALGPRESVLQIQDFKISSARGLYTKKGRRPLALFRRLPLPWRDLGAHDRHRRHVGSATSREDQSSEFKMTRGPIVRIQDDARTNRPLERTSGPNVLHLDFPPAVFVQS